MLVRSFFVGLALAMGVAFHTAPAEAEEPLELRFSFWGVFQDNDMWRTIARSFEEDNPGIKIKLEWVVGDYGQKLPLLMISDTAADAILMDDENYPAYAVRGYLEDLHPYIARQSDDIERLLAQELGMNGPEPAVDEREIFASSIESFTYRDHFGALPWDGFPMLMFYNKDLFDEAGLDYPDKDWTWEDFREMSKILTRDRDGDGYTDTWGANIGFLWIGIEPLVWSYGGRFLTPDRTRSAVMSPETLAAAQLLYDMKHVDHSMPYMTDVQDLLGEVQLLTGRVAMMTAGLYTIFALEAVPPEDTMRWGVALSPKGPGGEQYTRVSWDGISINSATTPEKKEAAWKFAKFLLTEKTQRIVAESGRGMPSRKSFVKKYFVKEPNIEYKELAVEAIGQGRLTPITPKFLELRQAMDTEFDPLNQNNNPPPVEVAFARIEPKINTILAEELARWGGGAQLESETIAQVSPLRFFLTTLAVVILLTSPVLLVPRVRRFIRLRLHETLHMAQGRMARVEAFHGILFASPWLIGLLCFTAGPIVFSIVLSFSRWDTLEHVDKISFIGFANFRRALSADPVTGDPLVRKALWNTFYYAAFAVPLGLATSLGLAMLLNQKIRGISVFRTVFYFPSIVAGVATSLLWLYIFNPSFGPLNGALRLMNIFLDKTVILAFIDLPTPGWIFDAGWAKPSMIIMSLWGAGGAAMLIFLAGLQGVPDVLYEVAELDGADRWRKFWNVTLPMLTPTIYFNLIMGFIAAWQVFMQAFVMVGERGGPGQSLLFYVLYLYKKAFIEYEMGYASALAWILFTIILSLTMLVVRSGSSWVYYEGERKG